MSVAALSAQSGVRNIGVAVTGDARSLTRSLAKASADIQTFEKSSSANATKFATAWRVAAAGVALSVIALVAGLTAAGIAASGFEKSMRNVNSLLLLNDQQFQSLSKSVLDIARVFPQNAENLAEGLYNIASSGFAGSDGLLILEASARAASAGISTTDTAAQVITASLNAYGLSAASAGDVSDILFSTVNYGVVEFDELAGSIGGVLGMASAAEVPLEDVGAAMATMTLSGVGAAEASTSLNRVIQSLIQPSDALSNAYQNLGYESGLQAIQTKGLYGVMEDLRGVTQGNAEAYLQLFPQIRAARGAFALAADEGSKYAELQGKIGDETSRSGATQIAFAEQMESASAKWDIFISSMKANVIEIGLKVLPAFVGLMDVISPLADNLLPSLAAGFQYVQPILESLKNTGANVVEVLEAMWDAAEPIAEAVGAIAAGATLAALSILADTLEAITGFMADNKAITIAVAALWLSRYLPSVTAVIGGLKKFMVQSKLAGVTAISSVKEQIRYQKVLARGSALNGQAVGNISSMRAAMAAASTTARGLGKALVSSGLATAGLAVGLMLIVNAANTAADGVKESISSITGDLDELDQTSMGNAIDQLNELKGEIQGIQEAQADKSGMFDQGALGQIVGLWDQYKGDKKMEATNNAIADINEKMANTTVNLTGLAAETGVSYDKLDGTMKKLGVNLTNAFGTEAAEAGRTEIIQYLDDIEKKTGISTGKMGEDMGLTVDQMGDLAEAISDATGKTASAFASATDVIGSWKPDIGVQEEADAMDKLADAKERLTSAEKDARDSAKDVRKTEGYTADDVLRDAEASADKLKGVREGVADAENTLQEAQKTKAEGTLEAYYTNAIKTSSKFSQNITDAVAAGLDPALVSKLLQEGPEQAGPIVQQLVDDNSGALIEMMNTAEEQLAAISGEIVEQSRLTTIAVQSNSDEMSKALPEALQVSALAWDGMTAAEIAKKLGLDKESVTKIAADFGISLVTEMDKLRIPDLGFTITASGNEGRPVNKGMYAFGGIYPGYTPGRDIGQIGVSGGESIMRPEFAKGVGHDWVHKMNKIALSGPEAVRKAMSQPFLGNYASGGVAPNSGASPQVVTVPVTQRVESNSPINIANMYSNDVKDFERQVRARRREKWGGRRVS